MTQRSPKRRRAEDLQFDPDMECEVMEPVSHALRNIIASARTNLAAATLQVETLQVMNLRIRASHAVEDAAVAYAEQMEQNQKTRRRKLWLQTVHAETLETILDEWKCAMTKSNVARRGLVHTQVKHWRRTNPYPVWSLFRHLDRLRA